MKNQENNKQILHATTHVYIQKPNFKSLLRWEKKNKQKPLSPSSIHKYY